MQDLALWLVANIPLPLRVAVGHFLPLALSLLFLWQLRGKLRTRVALPWMFGVAAVGQILWLTAKLQTVTIDGRTGQAITLMVSAAIWVAVFGAGVATTAGRKVDYRALFAGAFMPLWAVDVLCCLKVFPGDYSKLVTAVGGAGPLDALFIGPVLAVIAARFFEYECKNYERWNAWIGRQFGKLKRLLPGQQPNLDQGDNPIARALEQARSPRSCVALVLPTQHHVRMALKELQANPALTVSKIQRSAVLATGGQILLFTFADVENQRIIGYRFTNAVVQFPSDVSGETVNKVAYEVRLRVRKHDESLGVPYLTFN